MRGRPEEALGLVEKAMRLDPRNREWYLLQFGLAYRLTGRYEEAIAALKRVAHPPSHSSACSRCYWLPSIVN